MDFDKKYTGDIAMAFAPQQTRESVATLHYDHYREAYADAPIPGTFGHSVKTTPGSNNSHTHTAKFDQSGNGHTTHDDGHDHSVRAFLVAPFIDPSGIYWHKHDGMLEKPGVDPTDGSPGK